MDEAKITQEELAARVVVPAAQVSIAELPVRVGAPGVAQPGEPRIELIRKGDVIQAIDITCSCGKRIRLKCEY
jgi:hypothetical protein